MTTEQEKHLEQLKYDFVKAIDEKYRKGQIEHGGDVWKKPGMIDNAMEEVLDLYVYLHVLREQLKK